MALQLPLNNTRIGASFPNGYARIATVAVTRQRGGGHSVMIDVVCYAQAPSSEDMREVDFKRYHIPQGDLPPNGNVIQQSYNWLKNHPDLAGAVDA